MPKFTKREVVRQYIKKYPKLPNASLARLILKKEPLLYDNSEAIRTEIRSILGQGRSRDVADKSMFAPPKPCNPYKLPDSKGTEKKVFKLPIVCDNVGIISDLQINYHDNTAILAAVKWLKEKEVNCIYILGDLVDFFGISDFLTDPRKRNLKTEVEDTVDFLKYLRHEFPTQTIYWNTNSNHELRMERYLLKKAPELLDVIDFDFETIYQLNELNIKVLKDYTYVKIGKLITLHGHTIFGKFANQVCKAKTLYDKLKVSALCSHVHQTSEWSTKDAKGEIITCWTLGCLMNIDNVEYNPHNAYNHGFCRVTTEKNGNYQVENKRILNGVVY